MRFAYHFQDDTNRAEMVWKQKIHSNGREFFAAPYLTAKEEYM